MKFIFDWCQKFDEEKREWRNDAKVLSLEIFQRECCFASAKVSIFLTDTSSIFSKKYAKIGVQLDDSVSKIDLLFSGRVVSFPIAFEKSCVQLELISEPKNYQNQLNEFEQKNIDQYQRINKHQFIKEPLNFDDLFFSEDDLNNPTIFLEGGTKCFYWDMKNGELFLSDINQGEKNIEICSKDILENSMNISLAREPYKKVSVSLSTKWTQYLSGLIDLYPFIAKKFSDGIICSLTNIKNKIRKLCNLHNDGYDILSCTVKETDPSKLIPLKIFSKTSAKFTLSDEESPKKTEITFKKFYFHGEMLLNWRRKQKRSETVNLNIVNTNVDYGREKKIYLKLNAIQLPRQYPNWNFFAHYKSGDKILFDGFIFECKENHFSGGSFDEIKWNKLEKIPDALINDNCNSFFETERGKNAIKYALQNAIALMNYSSRYVEISFCVNAANFLHTTINDQITLIDRRFESGKITGKIIKTRLLANANKKIMQITIASSLNKHISDSLDQINTYIDTLKIADNEKSTMKIDLQDIIKDVEVMNPPEEQEKVLAQTYAKSISELESQLKKHSTKIRLSLAPQNFGYTKSRDLNFPEFLLK